jgi:hypothetical protein
MATVANAKLTTAELLFTDTDASKLVSYSSTSVKYNNEDLINFSSPGVINFNTNVLRTTGVPKLATDVATKNYVDTLANGLLIKEAVVTATTEQIDLSTLVPGTTIDKVLLAEGNRILVKDQDEAKTNGVYVVQASGAPLRSEDLDSDSEFKNGVHVFVVGVTDVNTPDNTSVNANVGFVVVTPNAAGPFTVNTNDIVWRRFGKQGVHTFNTGFSTVNGVDISVDPDYITGLTDQAFENITKVGGTIDTKVSTYSNIIIGSDGSSSTIGGTIGNSINTKVGTLKTELIGVDTNPADDGLVGGLIDKYSNIIIGSDGSSTTIGGTIGNSIDTKVGTLKTELVGADGLTGLVGASVLALKTAVIGADGLTGLVGENLTKINTNTSALNTSALLNTSMVFWNKDTGVLETFGGMKHNGDGTGLIVQNLTCTSDRTKKTNIKTIENSNLIHQLRPVEYNWIDPKQDQRVKYGFIAQEVAEIFPSVVTKADGVFGVEYINLISHLVMEVQTMRKELDELKK